MTQSAEQQNTQTIVTASSSDLPVKQDNSFVTTGTEKVQLDLEDAPFLNEEREKEKKSSELATTESGELVDSDKNATDEEQPPKSKKKLIIIIGAALLLLLILAGAFLFIFAEEEEIVVLQNIIVVPTLPSEDIPQFFQIKLDPFWVDLKNHDDDVRFLVGTFILSMETQAIKNEIEMNIKIVRDAIYYYLINTSPEFLVDHENTDKVKAGISEIVNQYIVNGAVSEIYFDSFLMK